VTHDLYIFGSAVRGEVSSSSDIDVLAIPLASDQRDYPNSWSVYSPETIESYFRAGRLFAWHLHLEAKCIFSATPIPYISSLGAPAPYSSAREDIDDLADMLWQSVLEIRGKTNNLIYELGIAYTAIRDIAMAASWSLMDSPCFSRNAPYMLPIPCPISVEAYQGAMLARHCSTRGNEREIDAERVAKELLAAPLRSWVESIRSTT